MTRFVKFLVISTLFILFSFSTYAETKETIDVSNMEWNASEFIYDNTVKTVELTNVPNNLTIVYENNAYKEIGTYFARAYFIYDKDLYKISGYDSEKFESFSWSIVRGKYDTSKIIFKDTVVVYDGTPKSIYVNNIPNGVKVEYTNNEQIEPGIYTVKASFKGNQYYSKIEDMYATLTINKKDLVCDDGECKLISTNYGFNPTYHLKHYEIESSVYTDVELSKLGSYREIKSGFRLSIYDEFENIINIEKEVTIEIWLDESLVDDEIIEVYEYSSSGISKITTNRANDTISFDVTSLNSDFLIIGMRQTYSYGDNWKIGIIVLVILVFAGSIICMRKINDKHKYK